MRLLDDLLATLTDGDVVDVRLGLHWTAVVVEANGDRRCGLASTLVPEHHHNGKLDIPSAGTLQELSATEVAHFALSDHPTLASVGIATINALLPGWPELWQEQSAEEVIATLGEGKTVALIGHFPFVPRLRPRVGNLLVLDHHPVDGDLPAESAPDVLPQADVVAITGMALVNHTLESLLEHCPPQADVLLLGPSTPLSPILFEYQINLLCGSVVTAIDRVLSAVGQGANFRQIHRIGVRLVTMHQAASNDFDVQRPAND